MSPLLLLLCSAPHSPFLTIAFFSLPNSSANEPRITPPFPPCLKRPPHGFPLAAALSLSLSAPAFRHSDKPKVRFLSLSSLQTSRGGLLLAESALFTFLSLLFAADSGARQRAIAFFSSLYAFCHLADLRFSFFSSASRIKREFSGSSRAFPPTPTHSPATSSPCSSTRAPSALERKIFLRRRGSRQRSQARLPVAAAFSLPRALCLPSSLCCLPRIRGHARAPLLFFFSLRVLPPR